MIDIRIELRRTEAGWEQVTCFVLQRETQATVLEVPARVGETFPSKELAIATLKERVTFELQQNHRHESGQDVRWLITMEPEPVQEVRFADS